MYQCEVLTSCRVCSTIITQSFFLSSIIACFATIILFGFYSLYFFPTTTTTTTPTSSIAFSTNTSIIPNANRLLLEPFFHAFENLGHFRPFILPHISFHSPTSSFMQSDTIPKITTLHSLFPLPHFRPFSAPNSP